MLSLKLFHRYLFSPKSGSVVKTVSRICIAGVAVGVCAFIVVMSIMNGFNSSTRARYLKVEPHIVVTPSNGFDLAQIKSDQVSSVSPFEVQDIFLRTAESFSGAIAKGLPREALVDIFKSLKPITNEEPLDEYAPKHLYEVIEELKPGEVIIGTELARSAGLFEGDKVNILPPETLLLPAGEVPQVEQVTIKGLFTTNISETDGKYIFYVKNETLTSFQNTASRQSGFEVRLTQPGLYEQYLENIKPKAEIQTWVQRNASLFLALKVERWMMTIFLSLAALITSFTVVTVLVLLITQRKQDIGVLMTLGLSARHLKSIFTKIGFLLFSIGFTSGLVIGVLISLALSYYPLEVLPDIYYERTIPSKLDIPLVFWMSIFALLIGTIAAWLPAQRIASMSPVDVLRKN